MALNDLKVPLNRLEEGQWFTVGDMEFLVKGMTKSLNIKLQKAFSKKDTIDKIKAINEFVFNDLVTDWRGVTKLKLQEHVICDELYKDTVWYEIADIKFNIARLTSKVAQEISKCTNVDAKQRKTISAILVDWEDFKYNEDDKETVPFSKKLALEIFGDEQYRDFYRILREKAEDYPRYVESVDDNEIKFSKANIEKYFIDVDANDITNQLLSMANDDEAYRQDIINKEIEQIKK